MCSIYYYKILAFLLIIFTMCRLGCKPTLAQDSCSFNNIVNGSLGVEVNNLKVLSSAANANSITAINGSPGSIDVTCTSATTSINISSVVRSNNAGISVSNFTTTVIGLTSDIVSDNGGASMAVPIGTNSSQTLEVNILATYNSILKPGDYSYTVNLNATP